MKDSYKKAVIDLIDSGVKPDEVISGLRNVLQKRGHNNLLFSVLSSVSRTLEARGVSDTTLSVARETDAKEHKKAIDEALKNLGASGDYQLNIDDTLVGGFVVKSGNTVLDNSYKNRLANLYRNLTT